MGKTDERIDAYIDESAGFAEPIPFMSEKINLKDLTASYLSLGEEGVVQSTEGGDKFWALPAAEIEKFGENWLITEFYFDADWKTWEKHPHGEEIVYLLSGAMDLILDKDGARRTIELRSKGLVVVPRDTWHTAKVFEPSNVLVITHGKQTEIREAE
jgi:mannose-6-phosphate isomerase-like protein (cupin superfamily)